MFSGCITALVTPFRQGRLDVAGLRRNVRFQIENGVSGLLAAGSTGEAAQLTDPEFERLVRTIRDESRGRVPVLVGAGTSSTAKSVLMLRRVRRLGADAALVVAPYYVKPTQEGLYRHFRAVADAVDLPIVVYNIPGRTAVNIAPATLARLSRDCRTIVAVKEASGSLDQVSEVRVRCGRDFAILSGDDSLTLPMMAAGACGVVSVASNVVPADIARMIHSHSAGRNDAATALHLRLFPLIKALFVETNPIPVKAALGMLGMAAGEPRLPLTPLTAAGRQTVRQALKQYGLIGRRR